MSPVLGGGMLGSNPDTPYPSGIGGRLSTPSYQVISSAGIRLRSGNLNTMVDDMGKKKSLWPVAFVHSISYGNPRSKNSWAVSMMCAPQSPSAPIPKSYQQRHCPLTKSLLYMCPLVCICQSSQSMVSGIDSAFGKFLILTFHECHLRGIFICASMRVTSLIIPASFHALNSK